MNPSNIFELGLGITSPWQIVEQNLDTRIDPHRLELKIKTDRGAQFPCPDCGKLCKAHDFTERTWRHLNFFQHHCYITAPVPRVNCAEHGVKATIPPWTRKGSHFTLMFEATVMMLAHEMPIAALARYVEENDTRLWKLINHYVLKAVSKLDLSEVKAVALDETSSKRGHNYVTVFIDMERKDKPILFVTPGKGKATVASFKEHLKAHGGSASNILEVVCDMSPAFIASSKEHFENAEITLDWFHVTALVSRAMEDVRKSESKHTLMPKHLRWAILKNVDKLKPDQQDALIDLQKTNLATANAWRCKESLKWVRQAKTPRAAAWRLTNFLNYYKDLLKEKVYDPVQKALRTIESKRKMIEQRWKSTYSNARLEGLNGLFQAARARARGYRNQNTFMTMIYLIGAPLGKIIETFTQPPKTPLSI
jgi:transposase